MLDAVDFKILSQAEVDHIPAAATATEVHFVDSPVP
jgi:hypothetical protein